MQKIAHLPPTVRVSYKYGWYYENGEKLFHNCGIIYAKKARTLYCIMTRDLDLPEAQTFVGTTVHSINSFIEIVMNKHNSYK